MTTNERSRRGYAGAVAVALAIGSGLTGARAATINVPADYTTIEAAVAAAAAGDTIAIANGTYNPPSTLAITKALTLQGESQSGVIINASGFGSGYGIRVEASGVTLRDFTVLPPVTATRGTSSGGGYAIHATFNHTVPYSSYANLAIVNVSIENGNRTAFDIHGYDGVTLEGLTARGSAYGNGIQLTGCTGVTIEGCTTESNAWGGIAFYCSKASYLNRPCSGITVDLAKNAFDDLYVEDEFDLDNSVTVESATYTVDNEYSASAAMHRYTDGTLADALAIVNALNAKYANTASTVYDVVAGEPVTVVVQGQSIQAAIDAAVAGDTVAVAAGTYVENLTVNERITLAGAGSGAAGTVLASASGRAVTIAASGLSSSEQVLISGIRIDMQTAGTAIELNDGISFGRVEDCWVHGGNVGIRAGTGADFSHMEFVGLEFSGNVQDVYFATRSAPPGIADDILFADCTFSGSQKGIYVEKLSNAIITNCLFDTVASDSAYTWSAAIDINLKYGDYSNILIQDCTFTDCAVGALEGVAVCVKARGTGTDTGYASRPATLDGVTITGCTITGSERGIRLGEPGKTGMTGPTGVVITGNRIYDNEVTNGGSTSPGGDYINLTVVPAEISANYWGSDAPDFAAQLYGPASMTSYYADAALTLLLFFDIYVDDDFDASTPGWGVTHFATVQEGLNAAGVGGTVHVAAGTYVEQVEITRAVELVGAGAGQTIIKGFASMPLSFTTGSNANKPVVYVHDTDGAVIRDLTLDGDGQGNTNYRYDGFGFRNAGGMVSNCAVIAVRDTPFSGAQHGVAIYGYNDDGTTRTVEVLDCAITDFQKNAVALIGANMIAVVRGCTIVGAGSTTTTAQNGIQISGGAVGTVENNDVSGVYYGGSGWTASGILVSSAGAGTVVDGNTVDAQTAIYAYDSPSLSITDNVLDNRGGLTDWAVILYLSDDAVFTGNTVADANGSGLDVYESDNALVEDNTFTGNPYGIGVAGGSSGAVIRNNTIQGNTDGVIVESGSSATVTPNYWGDETGPGGEGSGSGDTIVGATGFSPWWEDAAMTILRYGDTQFMTDKVIGPGETFRVYGAATIGDGTTGPTWTVNDGTLEVDGLVLTDGASLVVRNGKLILHTSAGTTVIEGTFTIFDSWGTVYFEEDTTVDGDMLALVSHLVFSDGVTLTVNGSLTLDGCVMEGLNDGDTYTVQVNDGATFKMYRTEMYDCDLQVNADGAELESNLFNNNVTVGSDADGAMVYHNVFASGSLTDNGSGTVTTADGWGNVASQAETANNLALDPAGVDAERNLYIQPGAAVTVTMDVSRLNVPVSGCDALLGYNSYFFEASGTLEVGGGHWEYQIYSNWTEQALGAVTYGMIDSSIGVGLSAPREGTTDDAAVLVLGLTATTNEGVTKVFFRPPTDGNIPERTLLASAPAGDPVYVTPFTLNSGYITVDGTPPLAESFTGTQVREGTPVDVFADGEVTGTGTVTFTVDAYDALAGLDPAGPVLTLTNTAAGTSLPVTLVGSTTVDIGGTNYTRYTFTTTVEPTTADGTYDAAVTITDRSGNQTVLTDALTVDVTAPLAQGFTGTQLQESGIVDIFADGAIAQQGALVFTVDAYDALGGLSPDIPVLVLTNVAAGASLTPTFVGSEIVNIGGTNFTRYTFGALVEPTTPNGEYTATITVKDNAGNTASLTDSFTVQKNLCQVTVEIEGADAGPFDREVVFVATDSSDSVLKTWTRTVTFTGGVGTTDLTEVPDGMAHLSADTAWTLCNRLDASLDVNGQVTVSFTGAEALEGGDVNGDNRVDMLDYARLRYFWYTTDPTTDIDGDGQTSTSDYLILKSNWYQRGDPQ